MRLPEPLLTPDGSRTLWSPQYGQTYGSHHGAARQAQQVFLEGSGTHQHPAPRVLEVGFGLGQNFRTTLRRCLERGVPLHYLAWEADPLPARVLAEVAGEVPGRAGELWALLLTRWERLESGEVSLHAPDLTLTIRREDVAVARLPPHWASAVYLDAFSPASNPLPWSAPVLAQLAGSLQVGGVLATYSAAGAVRRGLAAAGLQVQRLPGPRGAAGGKREVLRAVRR